MEPLVTVIVLCFNHEKYVTSCLDSIKHQSYKNIELIIIDNGSADNSIRVINEYIYNQKDNFEYIELIKCDVNIGIPRAFNLGIKKAHGKYIKELAADDLLPYQSIELFTKNYEGNYESDFIVGNGFIVDENFQFCNLKNLGEKKLLYNEAIEYTASYFEKLIFRDNIAAPATMIKRETYDKYGLHDESFPFEDWDYWLNIMAHGGKFTFFNSVVVCYRRSTQSVTVLNRNDFNAVRKFQLYYDNNYKIISKYKVFLDKEARTQLECQMFEKYLLWGIKLNLKTEVKKVFKEASISKVKISFRNKIRYLLYLLGIYDIQNKIRTRS